MKTILVTGGAGYIGSHMVSLLIKEKYNVIVLDNLSKGHQDAVLGGELIIGDISDTQLVTHICTNKKIDAVIHFASFIEVGESVSNPAKYYQNNLVNTLSFLNALLALKIKYLVFSSSAAVYGEPQYTPIDETHPKKPLNPYGMTKWMIEQILLDFKKAYGLNSIALRYFNAAGAHPLGLLGEQHNPETHLIPLVLQVAKGEKKFLTIYGNDYDTKDGTCVRDYIHVMDLCNAHLLALNALFQGTDTTAYNLGTGNGFSVQEIIDSARNVTGHPIPVQVVSRREGDPAILIADPTKAFVELNFKPQYSELKTILSHAYNFSYKEKKTLPI